MTCFVYQGKRLTIAPRADVPNAMKPDGRYAHLVQQVLDTTQPWKEGDNPIETVEFPDPIFPMATIPRCNAKVFWGIHRGHHARTPGLSPFVIQRVPRSEMGMITIELIGSSNDPVLTRAYGGDYTPPLPWMGSAKEAEGGRLSCLKYWRTHAYLVRDLSLLRPGTRTSEPPPWFTRT